MMALPYCGSAVMVLSAVAAVPAMADTQAILKRFEIALGPAELSVHEFAKQAGVNVLADADILAGVTTNAVTGNLAAPQALEVLLAGTGLVGKFNAGGAAFIFRNPLAASSDRLLPPEDLQPVATITVTGYRASLVSSANDKKESVGFTDTISSEDFGKFPDQNAAESLSRIPGVSVGRDVTGEGMNVQIRGLGSSFTKILLNNAPISIASAGPIDSLNYANREVDLDLLPTELFSKMTVSKSLAASMIEGGAAGIVNIRSARPFDEGGQSLVMAYTRQKQRIANEWGDRGSMLGRHTWGDTFGILAGISFNRQKSRTSGFGSIGWTNPDLSILQNTNASRNETGGGNYTIPSVVPEGAGAGLIAGTSIDQRFLLAHNPGLDIQHIDNALVPRLGRIEEFFGDKKKAAAIFSAEYRPTTGLRFYVDTMYSRRHDTMMRVEYTWAVRSNSPIPLQMTVDRSDCSGGCVATSGTFANSRFFIEDRPYNQEVTLRGVNPGMEWKIAPDITFVSQINWTESRYHVEAPTIMPITAEGSGMTVSYANGQIPDIVFSQDLSNPGNFVWSGGRVNLANERRATSTKGFHGDLTWVHGKSNIKAGLAYDDIDRRIRNIDNSSAWQAAVCGNNPSVYLQNPNSQPLCDGSYTLGASAASLYPGYGSGYTAGQVTPLVYQGSLIPAGRLSGYLVMSPYGRLMIDWDRFRKDASYDDYAAMAPDVAGSLGGYVRERAAGFYLEANGSGVLAGFPLRYNAGVRFVRTRQGVGSYNAYVDPRNTSATLSGARYPNAARWLYVDRTYSNILPSATAAVNLRTNVVAKASASRTMTRANPTSLRPGIIFNSASADVGSLGNPVLDPYLSDNLDLGLDWFTGHEGYVSITAFAKRVKGFTVTDNITMPFNSLAQYGTTYETLASSQKTAIDNRGGPNAATVVMQRERNAGGALILKGLEIGLVQPLDKWLPVRGFGLSETLTLITQKTNGAETDRYVALGVPKKTNSFGIYYENHGYMARLSHVYTGRSQLTARNQNALPDAAVFNAPYKQADFSSSVDLAKILDEDGWPILTFNVINLNRAKRRQYFQFENATYASFDPGRTFQFGVRATF